MSGNNPIAEILTTREALLVGCSWLQVALDKLNEKDELNSEEFHAKVKLEAALEEVERAEYWLGVV